MAQFINYSDVIFDAFCLHTKRTEIIDRKHEILDKIGEYYNAGYDSILFVGFNPAILKVRVKEIYVAEVSDHVFQWLLEQGIKVQRYTDLRKFDCVVAFDEYLTFAASEDEQLALIKNLCHSSQGFVITTVKDYKNQDFKDREYSQPAMVRANNQLTAFTEIHDWSQKDKNAWETAVYQMQGPIVEFKGSYARRALFFKQLAKFSADAGATNFLVHKNIMYKSLIKKNYEHVISICFEN
jgi:hypothetical protein